MDNGLPTPPIEDLGLIRTSVSSSSRKSTMPPLKTTKSANRVTKRSSSHTSRSPAHEHAPTSPHHSADSRHKRVWKACERCRMKKTKCDGEFPCKRCKDDGLVCTAGTRKKTEYKQLPKGYAEVLEHTQFALIATVHKLYAMVREGQSWDLGEPDLNDRGQPIIHNIATKLGCIRPNADIDLPPHSVFPEDEAGLSQLAAELQAQRPDYDSNLDGIKMERNATEARSDRASSSELDHSDFEHDYMPNTLPTQCSSSSSSSSGNTNNIHSLSPQSFTSCNDFDVNTPMSAGIDSSTAAMFPDFSRPSLTASMPMWDMNQLDSMGDNLTSYMPQMNLNMADMMLSQGLVESEFGTIKPHMVSCPNPEAMLGLGDPMIYSGYNMEAAMRS